ncbi:MAG: protein kinase [Planctomycetes bacterium]|nr:protein kinase [Planctomycetota bacterium]
MTTGQRVGKYEVVAPLGAGATAQVFRATDLELRRSVALKILHPTEVENRKARERFAREAEALARLRHPGVVTVFEVSLESNPPFIAMELVEGPTLEETMRRAPLRSVVRLVHEAAAALGACHQAGIVHRDVKPDNLRVDPGGKIRVVDFGLARGEGGRLELTLTVAGEELGTPRYMAPEVLSGSRGGPEADVYALGVILYRALAKGRYPYTGRTVYQLAHKVTTQPPRPLPGNAPRALARACLKALARDPAERYPHAGTLAADLASWLSSGTVSVQAPRARRRALWTAGAAVVLLAGFGLAILSATRSREEKPERPEPVHDSPADVEKGDPDPAVEPAVSPGETGGPAAENPFVPRRTSPEAESRARDAEKAFIEAWNDFVSEDREVPAELLARIAGENPPSEFAPLAFLAAGKRHRESKDLAAWVADMVEISPAPPAIELETICDFAYQQVEEALARLVQKDEIYAGLKEKLQGRLSTEPSRSAHALGAIELARKEWPRAVAHLDAVTADADLPRGRRATAYFRRAQARYPWGRHEEAVADYRAAIDLDSRYEWLDRLFHEFNRAAQTAFAEKDPARGVRALDWAIKVNRSNRRHNRTWSLYYRIDMLEKLGRFDEGLADFDRALALEPGYVYTYYKRAEFRERREDLAGALADWKEAELMADTLPPGDAQRVREKRAELQAKVGGG